MQGLGVPAEVWPAECDAIGQCMAEKEDDGDGVFAFDAERSALFFQ
jgi:hypothetical protein